MKCIFGLIGSTANLYSPSSAKSLMRGTRPTVLMVICLAPIPNSPLRRRTAVNTAFLLFSGCMWMHKGEVVNVKAQHLCRQKKENQAVYT